MSIYCTGDFLVHAWTVDAKGVQNFSALSDTLCGLPDALSNMERVPDPGLLWPTHVTDNVQNRPGFKLAPQLFV